MLPSSYLRPMQSVPAGLVLAPHLTEVEEDRARSASSLADAFGEFIATSARLEQSYRGLQEEVAGLRHELLERNAQLEQSLAENRRMRGTLEQMMDAMPCGVLVIDPTGVVSFVNPEARLLLGIQAKLTPPQVSGLIAELLPAVLFCHTTANEAEFEREMRVTVEGRERWLQVRRRILPEHRDPLGAHFLLLLRDVSLRRQAEDSREAGRQALAQAEISTVLAHEIRNPLASLELFAELIEQDEEGRSQWISHLRAGIRSLSGTVNNVLAFYGRGSWCEVPVALHQVVAEAVAFLQPQAVQASVSLQALDGPEAYVRGNADALRQLLLNLIANALRHTAAGGSVTVRLEFAMAQATLEMPFVHPTVRLECRDTGTGIDPALLETIFEPGFSAAGASSGLGLAVCRQIAQRHHGTIAATQPEGQGARFVVELPLLQQEEAA